MAVVFRRGLLASRGVLLRVGQQAPLRTVAAAAPLYDVVVSGGGMVGSAMAAVLGKAVIFSPDLGCPTGAAARPAVVAARAAVTAAQSTVVTPSLPLPLYCEVSEVFRPLAPCFVSLTSLGFRVPLPSLPLQLHEKLRTGSLPKTFVF